MREYFNIIAVAECGTICMETSDLKITVEVKFAIA